MLCYDMLCCAKQLGFLMVRVQECLADMSEPLSFLSIGVILCCAMLAMPFYDMLCQAAGDLDGQGSGVCG